MKYAIDGYLCESCKHRIALFGAHRGGVYCQGGDKPIMLHFYRNECNFYEHDGGDVIKCKFPLHEYPKLLSDAEYKKFKETGKIQL